MAALAKLARAFVSFVLVETIVAGVKNFFRRRVEEALGQACGWTWRRVVFRGRPAEAQGAENADGPAAEGNANRLLPAQARVGARNVGTWTLCAAVAVGIFAVICLSPPTVSDDMHSLSVADLDKQASTWAEGRWLNIMLVGKTKAGEHTLATTFFGAADPLCGIHSLTLHGAHKNNVKVKLQYWESDVIHSYEMAEHLKTVDLIVYTIKMDDTLRDEDKRNLQRLADFGGELWDKSIFALTFANEVAHLDSKNRLQQNVRHFREKYEEWKEDIHKILSKNGVTFNSIPFVPTGHYTEPKLFSIPNWMSHFVKCMLTRIGDAKTRGGLWKATKDHVVLRKEANWKRWVAEMFWPPTNETTIECVQYH